jgi:hypothetical protein
MKAKKVYEFKQGQNPYDTMGVGKAVQIQKFVDVFEKFGKRTMPRDYKSSGSLWKKYYPFIDLSLIHI